MLRKVVVSLVVLVLFVGLASAAVLEGTLKKVDTTKNCCLVVDKDKKDVLVELEKDTKITLDGKAAKLADLKEGQKVKVTHEKNKASAVDASTK